MRAGDGRCSKQEPRVVFLVGAGRSGSTTLSQTLCSHPDGAFVTALEDRLRFLYGSRLRPYRAYGPLRRLRANDPLSSALKTRLEPSESWRLLGSEVSPGLVSSYRDLLCTDADPEFVRRLRR